MRSTVFFILPFVSVLFNYCSSNSEIPQVKTRHGTYRGHIIKSRGGRDIIAYKGVPYAQPPVGKLRFKEPVELEEKEGIFDALIEKECIQPGLNMGGGGPMFEQSKYVGSEDCLYMNIYIPKLKSNTKLLPVYFWIHGGAFYAGAGSDTWNGPQLLLDENRDMIFVAINYRLGVLGFLSANDVNLPGNLGLKDQTMALKWVKENIEAFGGDPDSVTIGGLSAGAASVSHHLNSKASKGLFHRAISQSGTADCSWARKTKKEANEIATNIISFLGCPFEPNELLNCLQELPADILLNSVDSVKVANTSLIMYLVPVIENDSPTAFMTKESITEGSNIPWLSGITNEEGLIFYQFLGLIEPGFFDLSILKTKYKELLPVVAYYEHSSDAEKITNELKNYYFKDEEFSEKTAKNFIQLLSDRMFNHGFHKSSRKYKGNLYTYLLSYRGKNSVAVLRPQGLENSVSHGDDSFYFFETKFAATKELKGQDLDVSNTLLNMWYNFIKKGDPTPDTSIWEESDGGRKYLEFTNDGPFMGSDIFKDRMDFLDSLERSNKFHDEL